MRSIFLTALLSVWCIYLVAGPAARKHLVRRGETLYSICRVYDLRLNDLLKANPTVARTKTIKAGQQLTIPANHKGMSAPVTIMRKTAPVKPAPVPSTPGVQYRDEDERANAQPAMVKAAATEASEKPVAETTEAATPKAFSIKAGSANASDYADLFNQYAMHGYSLVKTKGEANYLSENTSGNPYLALYNDAQVGTVINVINLMNKKTLYVKVIGRLSAMDASHEIIIKLSHQAAAEIGATDDKFLVEVEGIKQ